MTKFNMETNEQKDKKPGRLIQGKSKNRVELIITEII